MRKLIVLSFFLVAGNIAAQSKGVIIGKIIDLEVNNEPVLFANIQLKSTPITAHTNFNGNFEIKNLSPGAYTLLVSIAG